ncbi:Protein of unknown function [Pyronema omphalodes CBS 100304]|uniref:Uncharacterized protein n=1 Tax=Pyronema omphalodes (strain CBS 100304) TaxID=1076935 RepID=U4L9T3_PYROM|nr:Protein of unknown function [Pyronema omphalodes CBS 100304]
MLTNNALRPDVQASRHPDIPGIPGSPPMMCYSRPTGPTVP